MTPRDELAAKAVTLAAEAAGKLERWQTLFEHRLAEAEQTLHVPELREFVAYLTALKRALEIARLAAALQPGESNATGTALDSQALRRLLLEED